MKCLFGYADRYIQKSSWKDMALLKFCLFSMGILIGMQLPEKKQEKGGDNRGACLYRHVYSTDDKIHWCCDGKRGIVVDVRRIREYDYSLISIFLSL